MHQLSSKHLIWLQRSALIMMVMVAVYGYYAPHLYYTMDQWIFNTDASQFLPALFHYYDNTIFANNDYLGSIHRDIYLPFGYQLLFQLSSSIIDPIVFSKILPYILMTWYSVTMALAARHVAGYAGLITVFIITIAADTFFGFMVSSLPHAFALPVIALTLLGITSNRPMLLIYASFIGLAFFPPSALICASCLLGLISIPPKWGGFYFPHPLARRAGIAALGISVGYLLIAPMLNIVQEYGGIAMQEQSYASLDKAILAPLALLAWLSQSSANIFGITLYPLPLLLLLGSFGYVCTRDPIARRITSTIIILIATFWITSATSFESPANTIAQYATKTTRIS